MPSVFVNKVLLEHSHAHFYVLFMSAFTLQWESWIAFNTDCISPKTKIFTMKPFRLWAQLCQTLCGPMDCSLPGVLWPWNFSGQEYSSALPFPTSGDLPDLGIKTASLSLLHRQADSLPLMPPGNPHKGLQPLTGLDSNFLFTYPPIFTLLISISSLDWVKVILPNRDNKSKIGAEASNSHYLEIPCYLLPFL